MEQRVGTGEVTLHLHVLAVAQTQAFCRSSQWSSAFWKFQQTFRGPPSDDLACLLLLLKSPLSPGGRGGRGEGEVKGSDNIPTSKHCVILIYVCFECLMQFGVQFSISYSNSLGVVLLCTVEGTFASLLCSAATSLLLFFFTSANLVFSSETILMAWP